MSETAIDNCERCHGTGWRWRVPDGFNPFRAGGFSTARAMYKVECICKQSRLRQFATTPEGEAR